MVPTFGILWLPQKLYLLTGTMGHYCNNTDEYLEKVTILVAASQLEGISVVEESMLT